ncbi:MAG: hypothetical protein ACOY7J_22240 [Pseudomonadota bacterium]
MGDVVDFIEQLSTNKLLLITVALILGILLIRLIEKAIERGAFFSLNITVDGRNTKASPPTDEGV